MYLQFRFPVQLLRSGCLLGLVLLLNSCADQGQNEPPTLQQTSTAGESSPYILLKEEASDAGNVTQGKHSAAEYIYGTGEFMAPARPGGLPSVTKSEDGTIDLNFLESDVRAVVDAVLSDMLSLHYVLDPAVKGKITLQSNRSLGKTEVLMALEEALRLVNVAMIKSEGVFHIIPLKDAPRRVTSIRRPVPPSVNLPGFGVQAVSLDYTTPSEMAKLLQSFAPQGSILSIDNSRNLLLLAGTAKELATLQELIRTFDVDWLQGMSFALFSLQQVDAKTVKEELSVIFNDAETPVSGMIKFIPMPRLNSLLAISHSKDYLRRAEEWIARLDTGGQTSGRQIYVYHVEHGKVEGIASALSQILGDTKGGETKEELGTPAPAAGIRRPSFQPSPGESGSFFSEGRLKIVPNVDDNSLLILATPEEYGVIVKAIKQMDIVPRQVMIEATLAEVTLNDNLQYGVNWFLETGSNSFTFSDSSSGGVASSFPGFSYVYTGSNSNRAVLNAISSVTDVKVISSPKLMVLNNQTANLQIGDQVPVAKQSSQSSTDSNAPIVNTIEFRDTGVILNITPHINKGGLVLLDVSQEVSDVAETISSGIDSPTIQQRKIESSIAIQNGETVALGGLIRENITDSKSGLPLLKDIPLLGAAFSTNSTVTRRTELIVLITPRVLENSGDVRESLENLKQEFERLTPFPTSAFEIKDDAQAN
ncbi:type II secretion system secretin GspD [Emcibacter nanhaiensis]|uniref:Type II secretion system protein GspD n=1 Tax=Emcibacter nanhaiensis TaxID=1505037 RepID=A0A501PEY3_9PROT|nr:type II secretion system secretin GspD [Emcibacter nanhaiensis]TPD58980.1 type II secretion system protein GspD [Emcibacter nanhaiensis]